MVATVRHKLLTDSWTTAVEILETAVEKFTSERPLLNPCRVVFFEIAGDGQLHVNVTHQQETIAVKGWAGPGRLPDGFVHNQRFDDAPTREILRQVREVVYAPRV
jgi:hypothetical protein